MTEEEKKEKKEKKDEDLYEFLLEKIDKDFQNILDGKIHPSKTIFDFKNPNQRKVGSRLGVKAINNCSTRFIFDVDYDRKNITIQKNFEKIEQKYKNIPHLCDIIVEQALRIKNDLDKNYKDPNFGEDFDECGTNDYEHIYSTSIFKDCDENSPYYGGTYYNTYGGGPEGGYLVIPDPEPVCDTYPFKVYEICRNWGKPWEFTRRMNTMLVLDYDKNQNPTDCLLKSFITPKLLPHNC